MGSFNTQCFATKQTIAPDDKVFIFPVIPATGYSPVELSGQGANPALKAFAASCTTCHANRYWQPLGLCLQGRYADYGEFELDSSELNLRQLLMFYRFLLEHSFIAEQGENSAHEGAFNLEQYALNQGDLVLDEESQTRFALNDNAPANLVGSRTETQLMAFWEHFEKAQSKGRVFTTHPYQDNPVRSVHLAVASEAAVRSAKVALRDIPERYYPSEVYENFTAHNLELVRNLKNWARRKAASVTDGFACESIVAFLQEKYPAVNWPEGVLSLFESYLSQGINSSSVLDWIYSEALCQRAASFCKLFQVSDSGGFLQIFESVFRNRVAQEICSEHAELSEEFVAWFECNMDLDLFLRVLQHLDLAIEPMGYVTQDYDNSVGAYYSKWVASVSDEIRTNRLKHYEEEDGPVQAQQSTERELVKLTQQVLDQYRSFNEAQANAQADIESGAQVHGSLSALEGARGMLQFAIDDLNIVISRIQAASNSN